MFQRALLEHVQLVEEETAEGLNDQLVTMGVAEGTCKVVSDTLSREEGLESVEYGF